MSVLSLLMQQQTIVILAKKLNEQGATWSSCLPVPVHRSPRAGGPLHRLDPAQVRLKTDALLPRSPSTFPKNSCPPKRYSTQKFTCDSERSRIISFLHVDVDRSCPSVKANVSYLFRSKRQLMIHLVLISVYVLVHCLPPPYLRVSYL